MLHKDVETEQPTETKTRQEYDLVTLIRTCRKGQTHFRHIWAVKKHIRYNIQLITEKTYDCDPKCVRSGTSG